MSISDGPRADGSAVPVPVNLPPGAVPLPAGEALPRQDGVPYPVEQRVTSTELRSHEHDQPDDGPPVRLLEALPPGMVQDVLLPLPYALATSSVPRAALRVADSAPARAKGYTCAPFYKPISRCVGGRG
jgi:hypothetical protein